MKSDFASVVDEILNLKKIPHKDEGIYMQIEEKIQKLFLLLPDNINGVKLEGQAFFREEYLNTLPEIASLTTLLLPKEQSKETK